MTLRHKLAAELRGLCSVVVTDPDGVKDRMLTLADRLDGKYHVRCEVCQADITSTRFYQRFCSGACKQKAYRDRHGIGRDKPRKPAEAAK